MQSLLSCSSFTFTPAPLIILLTFADKNCLSCVDVASHRVSLRALACTDKFKYDTVPYRLLTHLATPCHARVPLRCRECRGISNTIPKIPTANFSLLNTCVCVCVSVWHNDKHIGLSNFFGKKAFAPVRSLLTKSLHITGEPAPRHVGVRICEGVCVCVWVYYCVCSSFECSLELRLRLHLPGCSATRSASVQTALSSLDKFQYAKFGWARRTLSCSLLSYFSTYSCSQPASSLAISCVARVCAAVFVCVVVFPPLAAIYDTIHTLTDTHIHTHTHTCILACVYLQSGWRSDWLAGRLAGWLAGV